MVGPAALTINETGMMAGLPAAPLEATVTEPLYVPAARPVMFAITLMEPGTVPLAGVADSHEPPDVVAEAAVKVIPDVPVMLTACAPGALPPVVKLNVRGVVATVKVVDATFKVTGIFKGLLVAPDAVI
jgi:hypothetical protein